MSTVLGAMDAGQLARRYESGRGRGEREGYSPWLYVREVRSRAPGYVQRGWIVDRQHHLLSGIERAAFNAAERLPGVTDVREQFPLWPVESTMAIAAEIGVPHPRVPGSEFPNLMTTDLVLTTDWPGRGTVPIHVKPADDLDSRRNQEKLGIESEWWRRHGSDLRVVTELELPKPLAENLAVLAHNRRGVEPAALCGIEHGDAVAALLAAMDADPGRPAAALAHGVDRALGFEAGVGLRLFWHLVATGRLRIDLGARFDPAAPFRLLEAS